MRSVHCSLKDFDLDRFLGVNLDFANLLSDNGDYNVIRCRRGVYPEWDYFEDVSELREAFNNGNVFFFAFHERFSADATSVLCIDGEIAVGTEGGFEVKNSPMEDRNYGFIVRKEDDKIAIYPGLLIDPDYKNIKKPIVSEIVWYIASEEGKYGQFDARMTYFLKQFRTDQQVKEHMMEAI